MRRLRRWLRSRRGTFGPRPTVLGLVKALIVVTIVFIVSASPAVAYYQEPGINGVASRLAGKKVTVRCATPRDEARNYVFVSGAEAYVEGYYSWGRWFPKRTAHFRGVHCNNLTAGLRYDLSGIDVHAFALSLLVLVHESGHLRGKPWSGDEARTQCWAMQHAKAGLYMLGFQSPIQWRIIRHELILIHKDELSPEYQLKSCRLPSV